MSPHPTNTTRYETAHHSQDLQWVPMTKPTGWYTVALHDIKIGGESLGVDASAVRACVLPADNSRMEGARPVLCGWVAGIIHTSIHASTIRALSQPCLYAHTYTRIHA